MRLISALLLCASYAMAAGELSGRRAPGFALPDVMTLAYHDPADYRGKVLIVEFMQSTCEHCEKFSGILEKVKAKYGNRVAILSITNPPDNQNTVGQYVRQNKVTVPILYDCGQVAASYLKATPQNPSVSVPHVFLIDAQGTIRNDFGYGLLTRSIFEGNGLFAEIDKLLGAAPATKAAPKQK
jgi:thiol-disulfide isomerase/thioredoxin